jgi:hypothetical protein
MKKKIKTGLFLVLLVMAFLNSCSCHSDPEDIAKQLEKYPGIKQVVFVLLKPDDWFDTIDIGVLLEDNEFIAIYGLNYRLGTAESYIMDIGSFHFQYSYYDYDKKQKTLDTLITIKDLESASGLKFRSIKSIIKNYDVILSTIKRIHSKSS